MTDEQFDEVIDVNLKGTFLVTQIACQQLIQHGDGRGGSIVNISSISAKIGNLGQANYVAAKAGVSGMSICLGLTVKERCFMTGYQCVRFLVRVHENGGTRDGQVSHKSQYHRSR